MTQEQKEKIDELRLYLQGLPKLADKGRDERKRRAKEDFRYFVQTYLPHHVTPEETSAFRNSTYNSIKETVAKYSKILYLAYRGGAKTTVITRLFTLWEVIRGDAFYPAIFSATVDGVEDNIAFIKTEFEENINLVTDFDIVRTKRDIWQSAEFTLTIEGRKIKVEGYGAGQKVRGRNYYGRRPDLLILDDIENDENVESKTQRDKLEKWFKKAISKLPDRKRKYTLIIVGTLLHYDAVLKRLSKRRDFHVESHPLVLKFPEHMDEWQELYEMPDRDDAIAEYTSNRAFYDEGLILDDPELNTFELMMEYFEDMESFFSEYQNEPMSAENAILGKYQTYEALPADLIYAMGLDPALGKNKGDYFGVAVVGKSPSMKRFYVVYARGFKLSPLAMLYKIIEIFKLYDPKYVLAETVQFQEFYKDSLKAKAVEAGIYLPVIPIKTHSNKEIRLTALSPYLADETLLVNNNDKLLLEELNTFPLGAHDDIIDAIEMAFRHLLKSSFDWNAYKKATKQRVTKQTNIKDFI